MTRILDELDNWMVAIFTLPVWPDDLYLTDESSVSSCHHLAKLRNPVSVAKKASPCVISEDLLGVL